MEDINAEEVREVIKNLKKKKAAGHDQIMNEAWMFGEEELVDDLTAVLNGVWKGGKVPKEWKTGTIRPIYKKGDRK